ncbi:putative methyltransferase-domain-containing protein [Phaeosphaeriaceae sp. PMI808]|nr:putative methyltransferase-domain-containing protein [Phaeosphaeriaceae sp. PMI808]
MRYIRFLKIPRVVIEKGTAKRQVSCLITITSDLGDSFLPRDIQLSAELLSGEPSEQLIVWRTLQWTTGMRSLPITFPLTKIRTLSTLRVRVGVEPKSTQDEYSRLSGNDLSGVVSAWSSRFSLSPVLGETGMVVERRFSLSNENTASIYEETGESIARHLWDAGIAFSCHVSDLLNVNSQLAKALLSSKPITTFSVLELGTGCGMVGISIAQTIEGAKVLVTDLAEAQEIAENNISQTRLAKGSTLCFQVLDWDDELPINLQLPSSGVNLVIAADCTYNSDSSPALVKTLQRVSNISPGVRVAIAMKMRHISEEIFFELMVAAGFRETNTIQWSLPGDIVLGEEAVHLHVYQYNCSA